MEISRRTPHCSAVTEGVLPNGRQCLTVVSKGTYTIPLSPSASPVLAKQTELVEADEFWGEPGESAPKHECDFVPFKPMCDVIVNACGYSTSDPHHLNSHAKVGIRIGRWQKAMKVIGDRTWIDRVLTWGVSEPSPFYKIPIHYANAYGGTDKTLESKGRVEAYTENPVGRGFYKHASSDAIHGQRLPNIEEFNKPITSLTTPYKPMSFGPVGRAWQQRSQYAGTYDALWKKNVAPRLPADFDARYYQAAPQDQQLPYLLGGEKVELFGLTPELVTRFHLPVVPMFFTVFMKNGPHVDLTPVIDTLSIDAEARIFSLTWRAHIPITHDLFDVSEVLIGKVTKAMLRARLTNKRHYHSLSSLVDEQSNPIVESQIRPHLLDTMADDFLIKNMDSLKNEGIVYGE